MKKIYLDYASTTQVDERVLKEMNPYFSEKFGNTMSLHYFGQEVKVALEQSREIVADLIKAKPSEVIFTGSATESNNLALKGIAQRKKKGTIIISSIEHPCIVESARFLEKKGFKIVRLPVDKYGIIDIGYLKRVITKETLLVSIIHASNEIGTIQPIERIGKICKERGVLFHTDASQSFGKIDIDVNKMNIDLLTASSHKIYGPKGSALLFIKQGVELDPIIHGGGQELGLRASTVNLPAIVGFAKAVELCKQEMKQESKRQKELRDYVIKKVLRIRGVHLNGHSEKRLVNNMNFWFSFIEGESLVIQLDLAGIACSTGSACSSMKLEPSHVLLAIGLRPEQAHGSLRVSIGRYTTKKELDYFLKVLPKVVDQLRSISPFKK